MMFKKLVAAACGLAMLSTSALAQAACDPAKLSKIVDGFSAAPFSAATWRMLNGLGNPADDPAFKGVNRAVDSDWDGQDEWKKLAAQILPAGQEPRQIGYDCRISYPLEVLKSRVASLTLQNPYVKQWFSVQEQVLKACSDPAAATTLPSPLEVQPALAQMQNDDRAYQEASIAFYKDKPKAIELFRAIAKTNSPHRAAARYNIANLLANAKNIAEARSEAAGILADPALASVHGITQNLLGYISNIEDTPAGWTALIDDSVKTIAAPKAEILSSQKNQDNYARALDDIDHLGVRAKNDDWWLNGTLPAGATVSKSIFDASRKYPMALWMMSGQSLQQNYDSAPWSLVGDKWQQRTTTYLDQALAVTPSGTQITGLPLDVLNTLRAKPDDATREALWGKVHSSLAAAQKSCGEAPETAALGPYIEQATRVSAQTGKFDQIYDELSKLPFASSGFYLNRVLNHLTQYMLGQGMAEEGRHLRDKLLTPALFAGVPSDLEPGVTNQLAQFMGYVAEDEAHWKQALALHSEKTSNGLLNLLPTKTLWAYADDPMFSTTQKALLTRVAWTREYALGKTPTADQTAKLYAANPKIKDAADKVAADYPKASAEHQRLLTILRNPRLGIQVSAPDLWSSLEETGDDWTDVSSGDHNDRNWWCPLETDRHLAGLRADLGNNADMIGADSYNYKSLQAVFDQKLSDGMKAKMDGLLKQHPMVKAVDWKQVASLAAMPSAPKRLAQSAIRWGKSSKGADGAPEALALAVRTTHYGCNWHGRHRAYSRAAQELLKAKFASTTWAAQTPYWFDCQRLEWDKDYNKKAVCDARAWPKQAPLK
jgi:hypothetical protein